MKIFLDNRIIGSLAQNPDAIVKNHVLTDPCNHMGFTWPSLLEFLGLGSLFLNLPEFDQSGTVFKACLSALRALKTEDELFYLYDRLFTECLNQIKNLEQIDASFLLSAIQRQRLGFTLESQEKLFGPALDVYEAALKEKASETMHDLILYLAWDRMCVALGHLFDYQSTDEKINRGLAAFKNCLIESYQHIKEQGRTQPGIFRLMESLFFYEMREENLQKHKDGDWKLLNMSFPILQPQEKLSDFFYIDHAVALKPFENLKENDCYITLDSPEKVNSRLAFANYMIEKLQVEVPGWHYVLKQKKIITLNLMAREE